MTMVVHCDDCGTAYEAGDVYAFEVEQPSYAVEKGFPETQEFNLCEDCLAEMMEVLDLSRSEYTAPEDAPEPWSP